MLKAVVIHGDDSEKITKRRLEYEEFAKKKGWRIAQIDKNSKFSEESSLISLFPEEVFFVVNNLSSISKKDLSWIKEKSQDLEGKLLVVNEHPLTQTALKSLPKIEKEEKFMLPVFIWKFLESFWPGNKKETIKLLTQTTKSQPAEFLLALIARHFKDLYWIEAEPGGINMPSWKSSRLKSQAGKFGKRKLLKIMQKLAQIDLLSKTSKADLKHSLEMLVVSNLE